MWTGSRLGRWDYSVATEMFRTDGFVLVPDLVRGSVDTPANSKDATVYARIGHSLGERGTIFARGNFYTEFRNNGTIVQTNDTRIGEAAVGIDKQFGQNDSLTFRLYADVEQYNQRFSAVASDRNSETLTDIQHVPEQVVGGAAQWTHVLGKSQTLSAWSRPERGHRRERGTPPHRAESEQERRRPATHSRNVRRRHFSSREVDCSAGGARG